MVRTGCPRLVAVRIALLSGITPSSCTHPHMEARANQTNAHRNQPKQLWVRMEANVFRYPSGLTCRPSSSLMSSSLRHSSLLALTGSYLVTSKVCFTGSRPSSARRDLLEMKPILPRDQVFRHVFRHVVRQVFRHVGGAQFQEGGGWRGRDVHLVSVPALGGNQRRGAEGRGREGQQTAGQSGVRHRYQGSIPSREEEGRMY